MDPAGRPTETPRTVGWPVRSNFLANLRQWWSRAGARVRAVDFGEAFWKGSAIFSLVINLVLVAVVILLALNLFGLKRNVVTPLIGGLHTGFVQMDEAHIRTTVTVTQEVPVTLDLPIEEETVVVLSEPTTVEGANVSIRTGALSIAQAPSTVMLPAGTEPSCRSGSASRCLWRPPYRSKSPCRWISPWQRRSCTVPSSACVTSSRPTKRRSPSCRIAGRWPSGEGLASEARGTIRAASRPRSGEGP